MKKYYFYIFSLIFGVALYLFWAIPFRGMLNYHEELQLFLIDSDYFREHLTTCGGLSVYLSEALVQYYNNYWIGAAVLTFELLFVQWLTWNCLQTGFKIFSKKHYVLIYVLSYIPTLILWIVLGDFNLQHSILIAVILALTFIFISLHITKTIFARVLVLFLCLPLYVWTSWTNHLRYFEGQIDWNNIYNKDICEVLNYDLMVRSNKWQKIIERSRQIKSSESPIVVSATNLAFAMTNQLGISASDFKQHGTEGLIPFYNRLTLQSFTTGEIYFQLGLINTAQRLFFEGMEAIPNYKKSCRCIRRLAETNLINGQYEVARKYLHLLQKTLFYKNWATNILNMIDIGEDAINKHSLYGYLRGVRIEEDFLFSEREVDKIIGRLFYYNHNNRLALQYMLLYPILDKDVDTFMKYYKIAQSILPNNPEVEVFKRYLIKL